MFWAEKDDEVIAASILLCANGYMNYHLSGSLKKYATFASSNLLLYEAARWGNANGCKSFYLGGGVGSRDDGLLKFKKSFNRNASGHFFVGKKIYSLETYNYLCMQRGNSSGKIEFFPAYRG